MTVSLLEILAAARAHAAPLAAESAGYLLLAVADHVAVAPRAPLADEVELLTDGTLRLRARRGPALGEEAPEKAVRKLLARALEVSSSVGPALRRAAARRDEAGLPALVRELEVALIPVNRSAAKRALARLHRETERARDAGKLDLLLRAELQRNTEAAAPQVTPSALPPVALAAEFPEPSAAPLPAVTAVPVVAAEAFVAVPAAAAEPAAAPELSPAPARARPAAAPLPELTLTPEPQIAVGEQAFTKPEPVVQRARERGSRTPRLGTVVTAQTLAGEEGLLTERAPEIALADDELDVPIEVELEADDVSPAALAAQPLVDPEPSCMPDVLSAMLQLHTGVDADEAPTRLRDVVTSLRGEFAEPVVAVAVAEPVVAVAVAEPVVAVAVAEPAVAVAEPVVAVAEPVVAALTPEPAQVEEAWLTHSSLSGVVSEPTLFVSELAEPALHEALTWNPGPVLPARPKPKALMIAEPLPELSPYAPAVLPVRSSDVSELVDSFYVSGAAEERDLRSALKEMAGLELTPLPHPLIEER